MLLATGQARLDLANDEVAHLENARGSRVTVIEGQAWITLEGEHVDRILGRNESWVVDTDGAVTVSAIRGAASLAVGVPIAHGDDAAALVLRPSRRGSGSLAGRWRGWLTSVSISSNAVG
jgi:hypothetical protein